MSYKTFLLEYEDIPSRLICQNVFELNVTCKILLEPCISYPLYITEMKYMYSSCKSIYYEGHKHFLFIAKSTKKKFTITSIK